ncbi:hypothetical protein FH972_019972 [Carpinus fangiana]|uniref:BZIP domain-containing protein n=1 Tax=Carpinus fangiana TaxID=176857 RepID=A0A5N6RRW1_9ROSI|nr:hypothetical protein FH972_019972 [Carpinus fangiana]
MADPLVAEQPPNQKPHNFSSEFDSLPIPPLDFLYFSENNSNGVNNNSMSSEAYIADLGMGFGYDENLEFTFDDLEDLEIPFETEDFLIPDGLDAVQPSSVPGQPVHLSNSSSQESGVSEVSSHRFSDVAKFLNLPVSDSDSYGREYSTQVSSENSGDRDRDVARIMNFPSPESGGYDREFSGGSISSQGSGYRPPSPDSANVIVVDQKIKEEAVMGSKNCVSKRKKGQDEGNATDSRTTKYRRSLEDEALCEEEDKRKARLMRNRESAQLSRQRKKHYVEELEDKVRAMHSTISDLNSKISYIMAENATLRQQLSVSGGAAGGMCAPHSGMYPHPAMAPMAYPWVPCAPYVVKPQGSQVPLIPIPRLKSQQPASAPKVKKSESKKEGKTKKVTSVSFLGLLFFVLLCGGLAPFVNVRYGGIGDKVTGGYGYVSDRFYDQQRGKVLGVNGYLNGSGGSVGVGFSRGQFDISNRINYERGCIRGEGSKFEGNDHGSQPLPGSDEFVNLGNASERLVASLYVPRNDKLVKIDGNLIIHSILASEKAMASQTTPEKEDNIKTGLAIPRDLAPALAIPDVGGSRGRHSHLYRNPTGGHKALASGSADAMKDHSKSTAADGKLQQWFREGLAGPMLSSGMCTEVFQFDVSPASSPGAIIPASTVSNVPAGHRRNATRLNKGRNRRILHGLPAPLPGSNYNITEEHVRKNSQKESFQGNKSSPIIVSVLVDPREGGDSEVDGMITPKSLSRIFVVVLLDSVKYVTYSCVLPRSTGPHLVTT